MFNYVIPEDARNHERGLTKVESDFLHSPEDSIIWGDKLLASAQNIGGDLFRTLSHNLNGMSCSDANLDVKQAVKAIDAKDVAWSAGTR